MNEASLKLADKTVVIAGPFTPITQTLIAFFAEQGADVGLVGSDAQGGQKYADNVNDNREVNAKFGRAITVGADLTHRESTKDAIGRVAESFGSPDIFIDAHMLTAKPAPASAKDFTSLYAQAESEVLKPSIHFFEEALATLESKPRGRLIFLIQDLLRTGRKGESIASLARSGVLHFVRSLTLELTEKQACINCVSVGLTEDYLLKRFPGIGSIKLALEKFQSEYPKAQLTDPYEVAHVVGFLSSPLSSGVSGQVLSVNRGWV